ncbi:MAG: hypothetical protein K5821_15385 [Nitrobacter sp.]|uniref:3'-5' exonuclease n=1 Tax=Nitrobacter sp. TaxID=29420 RepID=UPI002633F985|nr:3'-5' exonuclease [Nitrobacter sp.]MCV0387767.1 hypothetical protein [Nitrobacter sp.]
MNTQIINVPIDAEAAARSLDLHADFRVLRRMREMDRPPNPSNRNVGRVGMAIDVETTGLDPNRHEVIELAMQRFRIDDAGFVIEVGKPRGWLEQPSVPIPPEIERITGLTDADVAGRTIHDGEATSMIKDVDFVVAHNASFDRPFVETRLPLASGVPWVCTLADIDWRSLGYEDRTLSGLLARMGLFFTAHRAQTDVTALLHLLDHMTRGSDRTIAALAVDQAAKPSAIIDAIGAPFSARTMLRERGYRWYQARRTWSIEIAESRMEQECGWLTQHVYGGRGKPDVRTVDWKSRYSQNLTRSS